MVPTRFSWKPPRGLAWRRGHLRALTASVALTLRGLRPVPGAMGALVAGWLVVVALAMSRRSEGDLLVVQNARGLAWLGLGVVVLVGVLVLPGSDAGASRSRG